MDMFWKKCLPALIIQDFCSIDCLLDPASLLTDCIPKRVVLMCLHDNGRSLRTTLKILIWYSNQGELTLV